MEQNMQVTGSTPLIIVDLSEDQPLIWPTNLYEINKYFPNVSFGIPQDEENLVPFNIFPIDPGTPPTGDVVTKITPVLTEGRWVQQYEVRDFNEQELADNLEAARNSALWQLDSVLGNTYDRGFNSPHGEGTDVFSMSSDNRQLITGLYLLASVEQDAERKFKLRTVANVTVEYSVDEMKALGKAVMEYVTAVLEKLWAYMDQITSATKIEDLPQVPDYIDLTA
jgi:hypothetical protein